METTNFKKIIALHQYEDSICTSSSILPIRLCDYIREVFRRLVYMSQKKRNKFLYDDLC